MVSEELSRVIARLREINPKWQWTRSAEGTGNEVIHFSQDADYGGFKRLWGQIFGPPLYHEESDYSENGILVVIDVIEDDNPEHPARGGRVEIIRETFEKRRAPAEFEFLKSFFTSIAAPFRSKWQEEVDKRSKDWERRIGKIRKNFFGK